MASPPTAQNPRNPQPVPTARLPRTAPSSRALEVASSVGVGLTNSPESSGSLRRGHSDGDVLASHRSGFMDDRRSDEETWMDFLRDSSRPIENADHSSRRNFIRGLEAQNLGRRQERQAAMQRAALVLADRKRRLTENQEDYTRRRSASSLPFGPAVASRRSDRSQNERPGPSFAASQLPRDLFLSSFIDRPLPRPFDNSGNPNHQNRDITIPRWQPDFEVTSCPICGTSFSFWFRKHHCRKCGRVVCANCSPHRITIPRQFIVQPPQGTHQTSNAGMPAGIEVLDLTEDQDAEALESQQSSRNFDTPQSPVLQIDPALGGGQEVRLCNPCVPDPNPLPHLPFESPTRLGIHSFPRPEFDRIRVPSNDSSPLSIADLPRRSSSTRHSFHQLSRSNFQTGDEPPGQEVGIDSSDQQSSIRPSRSRQFRNLQGNHPSAYGSVPDRTLHDRYLDSIPALHFRHRHHASASASASTIADSRYRSLSNLSAPLPPRPLPPRPPPQLREEDECPICHQALPPKSADGSETARERHVVECIEQHFASFTPRSARRDSSAATDAAITASAASASHNQAAGSGDMAQGRDRRSSESVFQRMGSQRRRVAGMVTYAATEKDCLGEGGEPAECVICFEEFEQGAEMGRLECLCKFHKVCIRQWWDKKGAGACPVHQGDLT